MHIFEKYALKIPDILLPNNEVDYSVWSVIACDQYTQDKQYWEAVSSITKNHYSTRHLILPEIYLNSLSEARRKEEIEKIHQTMKTYLHSTVFASPISAMMYIERKTVYGRVRKGIVTNIDLEKYDWKPAAKAEIRATEATIEERLPPRMEIRQGASIELPHIMLLVNDVDNILIEKIGAYIHKKAIAPVYDFNLMLGAGHIAGWSIPHEVYSTMMYEALDVLQTKNKDNDDSVFMFAVGDGNHSLAAAKAVWESYKRGCGCGILENGRLSIPKEIENHPLRYALVEIVNLYDTGLTFEPIHRVLFNVNSQELVAFVKSKLGGEVVKCKDKDELLQRVENSSAAFGFISKNEGYICLETELDCLAVSALQPVLDAFIKSEKQIDYIHGTEETIALSKNEQVVSVLLPPISKTSFFSTIAEYGSLPRKSFSMGEASEKRFYLECRSLSSV